MMLGVKPDYCGVVYTSFQCSLSARLALIKQGGNVNLSLLGDGLHDGMAESGGVLGLNLRLNVV